MVKKSKMNFAERFGISDVCQNSFKNQLFFGKFGSSEGTSEPDILCCARVLFGFLIILFRAKKKCNAPL